jgi:hypothetical protein
MLTPCKGFDNIKLKIDSFYKGESVSRVPHVMMVRTEWHRRNALHRIGIKAQADRFRFEISPSGFYFLNSKKECEYSAANWNNNGERF